MPFLNPDYDFYMAADPAHFNPTPRHKSLLTNYDHPTRPALHAS